MITLSSTRIGAATQECARRTRPDAGIHTLIVKVARSWETGVDRGLVDGARRALLL